MNKRRFVDTDNGFNLDLTYVCDRLIVMAIPCVDSAMYRNDIREVARFFATRHYGKPEMALLTAELILICKNFCLASILTFVHGLGALISGFTLLCSGACRSISCIQPLRGTSWTCFGCTDY